MALINKMISLENLNKSKPYQMFHKFYNRATKAGQSNIEAIAISSYNKKEKLVDSRFVNLKLIQDNEWIFFSNYQSPKAQAFKSHKQISILIFWDKINVQIRMQANIRQTKKSISNLHFLSRDDEKNAIAISSNQSNRIQSYQNVEVNFLDALNNQDLNKRPDYWGGFSFQPYYFEFWQGHNFRINKRQSFKLQNDKWESFYLEP